MDIKFLFIGIKAQVQLAIHFDNIVKITTPTLASLDLNFFRTPVIDNGFEIVQST
jgi:hypothetical protein